MAAAAAAAGVASQGMSDSEYFVNRNQKRTQHPSFDEMDNFIADRLQGEGYAFNAIRNYIGVCWYNSAIIALMSNPQIRKRAFDNETRNLRIMQSHVNPILDVFRDEFEHRCNEVIITEENKHESNEYEFEEYTEKLATVIKNVLLEHLNPDIPVHPDQPSIRNFSQRELKMVFDALVELSIVITVRDIFNTLGGDESKTTKTELDISQHIVLPAVISAIIYRTLGYTGSDGSGGYIMVVISLYLNGTVLDILYGKVDTVYDDVLYISASLNINDLVVKDRITLDDGSVYVLTTILAHPQNHVFPIIRYMTDNDLESKYGTYSAFYAMDSFYQSESLPRDGNSVLSFLRNAELFDNIKYVNLVYSLSKRDNNVAIMLQSHLESDIRRMEVRHRGVVEISRDIAPGFTNEHNLIQVKPRRNVHFINSSGGVFASHTVKHSKQIYIDKDNRLLTSPYDVYGATFTYNKSDNIFNLDNWFTMKNKMHALIPGLDDIRYTADSMYPFLTHAVKTVLYMNCNEYKRKMMLRVILEIAKNISDMGVYRHGIYGFTSSKIEEIDIIATMLLPYQTYDKFLNGQVLSRHTFWGQIPGESPLNVPFAINEIVCGDFTWNHRSVFEGQIESFDAENNIMRLEDALCPALGMIIYTERKKNTLIVTEILSDNHFRVEYNADAETNIQSGDYVYINLELYIRYPVSFKWFSNPPASFSDAVKVALWLHPAILEPSPEYKESTSLYVIYGLLLQGEYRAEIENMNPITLMAKMLNEAPEVVSTQPDADLQRQPQRMDVKHSADGYTVIRERRFVSWEILRDRLLEYGSQDWGGVTSAVVCYDKVRNSSILLLSGTDYKVQRRRGLAHKLILSDNDYRWRPDSSSLAPSSISPSTSTNIVTTALELRRTSLGIHDTSVLIQSTLPSSSRERNVIVIPELECMQSLEHCESSLHELLKESFNSIMTDSKTDESTKKYYTSYMLTLNAWLQSDLDTCIAICGSTMQLLNYLNGINASSRFEVRAFSLPQSAMSVHDIRFLNDRHQGLYLDDMINILHAQSSMDLSRVRYKPFATVQTDAVGALGNVYISR